MSFGKCFFEWRKNYARKLCKRKYQRQELQKLQKQNQKRSKQRKNSHEQTERSTEKNPGLRKMIKKKIPEDFRNFFLFINIDFL